MVVAVGGAPWVAVGDGLGEATTTVSVGVAVAVGEPASPANAPPLAKAISPVRKAKKERDIDEIDAPERISMARPPGNVAEGQRGPQTLHVGYLRRETPPRRFDRKPRARGEREAGRAPPQPWPLIMPCCASAAI